MRKKGSTATLAELMGKDMPSRLALVDLPVLLGEKMPEMPFNRIGRYRLNNALKMRFGPGYKNLPGVKSVLAEFDTNVKTENVIKMNKESQNGNND